MRALFHELQERARAMGFASLWVTDTLPFGDWARARRRRGDGFGSSLLADPQAAFSPVRRIVVLAFPYRDEPDQPFPQTRISAYYFASHRVHRLLPALAEWLRERGWQAMVRPPLPAKAAALRAGAGWYGRNGLLFTAEHGSRVVLALLPTDAELPVTGRVAGAPTNQAAYTAYGTQCEDCAACVRACPVGALDGTTAVDTARCLRAHMFSGKPTPEPLRTAMGNRLLGCDVCQQACPQNARAPLVVSAKKSLSITLDDILGPPGAREAAIQTLAEEIGTNYARPNRVLAQAALLVGNSADGRYLPALVPLCQSDNAAVREHARWAVNRLRGAGKGQGQRDGQG